jgi:hypothetical protein
MHIPAEKILELIDAARRMVEVLPESEQYIHANDIAATLQKIIDDEQAALDKWADEMERDAAAAEAFCDEAWGRLEIEESKVEKELWYVEGI